MKISQKRLDSYTFYVVTYDMVGKLIHKSGKIVSSLGITPQQVIMVTNFLKKGLTLMVKVS